MKKLKSDPRVKEKFDQYPEDMRHRMLELRQLVIDTAEGISDIAHLEETLKWGEPSYLNKHGSTIRMDWKSKAPDQFALYFKCTSKLVPTFKEVYPDDFSYEGNRAIVFRKKQRLPKRKLKACITAALLYHKVKNESRLGII